MKQMPRACPVESHVGSYGCDVNEKDATGLSRGVSRWLLRGLHC
jgi:hypothetical protein